MARPPAPASLPDLAGWRPLRDVTPAAAALGLDVLRSALDYGATVERGALLARVEPHYDDHAGGGERWHRGVTVYERVRDTEPAPPPEQPEHVSAAGRAFIGRCEGRVLRVYADSRGLPTCGVGHLLRPGDGVYGAPVGTAVAADVCDRLLAADLATVERAIHQWIHVPLSAPQFDALASFAFNLGVGVLRSSSVASAVNAEEHGDVPALMLAYCHAGGVVLPGLVRRRRAEGALYASSEPAGLTDEDRAQVLAMLAAYDPESGSYGA